MSRSKALSERIRELYIHGDWIANTNYTETLDKLNWEQASYRFGHLNTIVSLTYHINYYLAGIYHALVSGKLEISDKYSFDCKHIASEADWKLLVSELTSNAERLSDLIEAMEERQLEEPFADGKYGSIQRNIDGAIEHGYYHLGQMRLIIKLLPVT